MISLSVEKVLALFPVIRSPMLRMEPEFLHLNDTFLIFLEKRPTRTRCRRWLQRPCLSPVKFKECSYFLSGDKQDGSSHRKSRGLKTITSFGFGSLPCFLSIIHPEMLAEVGKLLKLVL